MTATITTTTAYGNTNLTIKYGKNRRFLCHTSPEAAAEAAAAYVKILTASGYKIAAA